MALNIDPLSILVTAIKAANKVGMELQAANSDTPALVKSIVDGSDNERVVAYRKTRAEFLVKIEEIQARLAKGEEGISAWCSDPKNGLLVGVPTDFDKEAKTKEFVTLRAAAHAAEKAILNFVSQEDLTAALKEMDVEAVKSLRGHGKVGTSTGTGVKRPRIATATLNGKSVFKAGSTDKVDFTALAAAGKTSADTLKSLAFAAAETEDLNSLAEGTAVSFSQSVNGVENNYVVTISGVKPGRPAGEKVAEIPTAVANADEAKM